MGLIWTKHKLFTGALFFALAIVGAFGVVDSTNTYATASTLSLSIDNNNLSLDIVPSMDGVFNSSASSNVTVSTNNATGYTLSIKANNSTALVNTADNTLTIPSISTAVSESDFSSSSTYNNMWGYKPSKFNSVNNTDYLPSPSTTGDILDATSAANTTANTYTLALGTRIDNNTAPGSYNNAFTIMAIANPLTYSVNYTNKTGVTATNMPANVVDAVTGAGEGTFTVSSTVPTRTGYTFNKWCTVEPTTTAGADACTGGTAYASGATYELDATTNPQTVALYAMWTLKSHTVTVNFAGSGVSGVTLSNSTYGGGGTVSTSGGTVSLKHGISYNISGTYSSGYEFSSWATAANGTLGSTTSANTTYSVTGASTLTLTGKQSCTPFPTNTAMQSFAGGNYCVNSGTLMDNRDNQTYRVAKLNDGKWWMVENLNLAGGKALSANNTDVTSSYISSFSTSNNLTKSGSTIVLPASSTSGFNTNNYSYVYNSGNKTNCGSSNQNTPCYSYYSWDAATLGSGRSISTDNTNAPYSICPKGWKLPTTYNGSGTAAGATDFRALMIGYGGSNSVQDYINTTTPTGTTMYGNIGPSPRSTPKFLLAGYYSSGSFYLGGIYGHYWSATSHSSTSYARFLYFNNNNVKSASCYDRYYGYSVRCLLR